jgi:hypothetical protein
LAWADDLLARSPANEEIDDVIVRAGSLPTSDDISFLELMR